jgi:hypothetical protein
MIDPNLPRHAPVLDLTRAPLLSGHVRPLEAAVVDREWQEALHGLAETDGIRERARRIAETVRKLGTQDVVLLLRAAGKSSLALEPAGLRVLFGFLEVKRPGGEVLRQLEHLSSLERVALHLIGGRSSPSAEAEKTAFSILDVLGEAMEVGVIDLDLESLPGNPGVVRDLFRHLRAWFVDARTGLELGQRFPEAKIQYLTHLALIEIHCLEDRLFRLAARIDPYDAPRTARMLPILSRYDQDIEHMKDVVSRLSTYRPFTERQLTVEHAVSSEEMDRLGRQLAEHESTAGLARLTAGLRRHLILDRRFAAFVAFTHEIGVLRARALRGGSPPDLHSTMLAVLENVVGESSLRMRLEETVLDALAMTLESRGIQRAGTDLLEISLRDDQLQDFLAPDGTPRFGALQEPARKLSLKDLVRTQLQNDAFILGILENPRATSIPGVVELIAGQSRSLRVLDKITRTPTLYTGPANKNVAAFLLLNPSRIPITHLRQFMNVRFVSKMELKHMTRSKGSLRPEVAHEIDAYLRTLKSN